MPEAASLGLRDGDHACILFGSDAQQREVVGAFLAEGLRTRQRVLNLPDVPGPDGMRAILRDAGVDPGPCEAGGQLTIRAAPEAYLPGGRFDPEAMVGMLRQTLERALADGWDGMRGSGDMGWALAHPPGSDRIMEYEARLNQVMPGTRFRALCQYDMRRFDAATLLEVLTTHPIAFVGTERLENFYHMPPEEYLGAQRPEAQLARWLGNLRSRQVDEARARAELAREERIKRAQAELEAKRAFLNAAAHELSTPLTPAAIEAAILLEAPGHETLEAHRARLQRLRRALQRLEGVVQRVLAAGRAQAGIVDVRCQPADLGAVARRALEQARPAAMAAGLRLEADCDRRVGVFGDEDAMRQALAAVLANAVRFTPPGGRVQVRVANDGAGGAVEVQDSGIGLPEGADVFAPFANVHDPMGVVQQGAGLGLYLARAMVEAQGGRIWARSAGQDQGTTVGFWIPASAAQGAPARVETWPVATAPPRPALVETRGAGARANGEPGAPAAGAAAPVAAPSPAAASANPRRRLPRGPGRGGPESPATRRASAPPRRPARSRAQHRPCPPAAPGGRAPLGASLEAPCGGPKMAAR